MSEKKFSKKHEWVSLDGDVATVGITKHATEMLGDIVFVEVPDAGKALPASGTSTKTMSPSISVACLVIPTVATSPSSETHSCFLENFFSLIFVSPYLT